MDIPVDQAESIFNSIFDELESQLSNVDTEEDTKLRIINRILIEVLGWTTSDIDCETKNDNGFSDYLISDNESPVLVLEAKKQGLLKINSSKQDEMRTLKLSGTSLSKCQDGIEQAASYIQNSGAAFAVLCDGTAWIIFKAYIPGANYKDKEAFVFPSINAIRNNFSSFYELLSKPASRQRLYSFKFDDLHHRRLNLTQKLHSAISENEVRISQKSTLAMDLEKVFDRYFAAMAGSDDDEIIMECFVESRESRIADFSLEKITAKVLGNIGYKIDVNNQLSELIHDTVSVEENQRTGETVFIVGPTGSGKTTFLERFFKKTLSRSLKEKCLILNVNCLHHTGSEDTVLSWLTQELIGIIERSIFEEGSPSWDDLMSLYVGEYRRRARGSDKHLYDSDKTAFKVKFGEFLDEQVEKNREEYLKRLLREIVRNRKKLPIFIVDNTDEKSIEYKTRVFQYLQSMQFEAHHSLLFFPVTDRSAWAFKKTDIFGIYESKSFFLPTPSPREVFRKRADYLKRTLDFIGTNKEIAHENYLAQKGIRISIENLQGFTQALESIFVDHEFTSKTIGQLSNYNIRKTLLLSKRVLTSSVVKIEDLVRSYISGKPITTSYSRFIDALLKGNYSLYKRNDDSEILPIFDVDQRVRQSPLINIRILSLLAQVYNNGKNAEEKHLGLNSLISYFESIGGDEVSVVTAVSGLLEAKLIEPYDISMSGITNEPDLAITHKGLIHLQLGLKNAVFFYQMALITDISDEVVAQRIKRAYKLPEFSDRISAVKQEFSLFLLEEDKKYFKQKTSARNYDCQIDVIQEIKKFSDDSKKPENDLVSTMGEQFKDGLLFDETLCTVAWYDPKKRYGYANVEELEEGVFFHLDRLLECGISYISESDKILCQVSRSSKGLQIDKIFDVEIDSQSIEKDKCTIIRLFEDRDYGFALIGNSEDVAYFPTYLFNSKARKELKVGHQFTAEIILDSSLGSYQIRSVLSSDGVDKLV